MRESTRLTNSAAGRQVDVPKSNLVACPVFAALAHIGKELLQFFPDREDLMLTRGCTFNVFCLSRFVKTVLQFLNLLFEYAGPRDGR